VVGNREVAALFAMENCIDKIQQFS